MTETVITFTTAQLWGWVLAICGSVTQRAPNPGALFMYKKEVYL